MTLLKKINIPDDLKKLSISQLPSFCDELREATIEAVSKTGGHLGAGLGVVELTSALHYSFNTPEDKIIWDVGHQTYPHKILTGRKDKITTLRQKDGLSGFTKIKESIYDTFGAGHSSTSISAAIGMAEGYKLSGNDSKIIAVIGDGAMSAGMAYEGLNNASRAGGNLIIILNDNQMSISPAVGSMSKYLSKLILSKSFLTAKNLVKSAINFAPEQIKHIISRAAKGTKSTLVGGNFFDGLGLEYIGPVDGHDCCLLVELFDKIKQRNANDKPILLHIITEKGKGFNSPVACGEKYHGVNKFDPLTLIQSKTTSATKPILEQSFTSIFADELCKIAEKDDKIIAITAAMKSGTGLNNFAKNYPNRFFDVGIAEQHAVTFAGGLSLCGFKAFICIYSTFLQRAYDQIVHDIAIQKLPVRFAIDRAGFVGADGPTHSGSFDISFLCSLPGFVVMAASSAQELKDMVFTAYHYNDGPIAFRYPRGNAPSPSTREAQIIPIGKAELLHRGANLAILSLGTRLEDSKLVWQILQENGFNITLVNARFAKPVDEALLIKLAADHTHFLTIEEGSIGGFSAQVKNIMDNNNLQEVTLHSIFYQDLFLDHDSQDNMHKDSFMDATSIANKVKNILQSNKIKEELFAI